MGTDIFSQATEQGCLAIGSQITAFFVIGLTLVLPASAFTLAIFFTDQVPITLVAVASIIWGFLIYGIGLTLGSWVTARRMPEILHWVTI